MTDGVFFLFCVFWLIVILCNLRIHLVSSAILSHRYMERWLNSLHKNYSHLVVFLISAALPLAAADSPREAALKADLAGQIDGMKKQAQVMNDMVFSFAELGFQEVETSKYLTGILEKEGFTIERGIAGVPTAWMATWGSGKPV